MQDNCNNKKYSLLLTNYYDYQPAAVYDTIEECIVAAKEYFGNHVPNSITIQELAPYDIHIIGENVLDDLWSQVEADVGDAADDWLTGKDYTTEQLDDLSERLTGVIKTWLKETHNEPPFFSILSEKEIPISDIPK